ncbi:helix-turn-helix domain-containing protein [Chitinophaga arvensicola]|uniref:AraC-type DNA-binding protein n=1 Tax=Chitinophaga arvensicola TaxID=29529 RepID=A0A1I0S4C9_9BACT|nr:AraC family transcriptional regulator [Chitinophaga arvensicola]SEW49618.1 AraC-type DNA-binding protein [Chitinophaga arvensicola]
MAKEINLHGIQRTCYAKSSKAGEQFIKDHGLSWIVSGEMEAYDGHTKYVYRKGDIVLYRKNALVRFVKYPAHDEAFEAISVILDESLLQDFSQQQQLVSQKAMKESLFKLEPDELIQGYFIALQPWFDHHMNTDLVELKKKELIHLLLHHNKNFRDLLFHFGTPGKINLEGFMNTHYHFNVPLSELAFLTGRSLATFKRDFEKIFQTSPNRWLQQKRLEEAYYLLHNKKMKSKDVYLEVGFETLSHFSYAFKNKFGVSPSNI